MLVSMPILKELKFNSQWYRMVIALTKGKKPPCINCTDEKIEFCSITRYECRQFFNYLNAPYY